MNALELRDKLNKLYEKIGEEELKNLTVAVPIFGLSGSAAEIKSVYTGFDWESGLLILQTQNLLYDIHHRKVQKLMDCWYKKHSNKHKLYKMSKPYIAQYKKESSEFSDRWAAESWIHKKAQEDLNNLIK